jgi:hypothetical protein
MWRKSLPVVLACLFLALPLAAQATPGAVLVPRSDAVRLYHNPSTSSDVLQVLTRGHRLLEFRRRDGWIEVAVFRAVGLRGWLRSSEVVRERAIPDPPPPNPARQATLSEESPAYSFELFVAGTPALAFRASCRVVAGDTSEETLKFAGQVPHRATLAADAVSCTVTKTDSPGRLEVRLLRASRRLAAERTTAAFNWVRVRSDGPWGAAGSLRGSVGLVVSQPPEPPPGGRRVSLPPRRIPPPSPAPR